MPARRCGSSGRRQATKGRKLVALKTGQKALRTIDIDYDTVAVLTRQRDTVPEDRRQWGADYQDVGLVFPREDGTAHAPLDDRSAAGAARRNGTP